MVLILTYNKVKLFSEEQGLGFSEWAMLEVGFRESRNLSSQSIGYVNKKHPPHSDTFPHTPSQLT